MNSAANGMQRVPTAGRAVLQRKCACGGTPTAASGECAECRKKREQTTLQRQVSTAPSVAGTDLSAAPVRNFPSLVIGRADDPLEREADAVANAVLGGRQSGGLSGSAGRRVQRARSRAEGGTCAALAEAPGLVHEVLTSPGQPLDRATRGFMEDRFGHDFSGVRIHDSARAAASARAVNAAAYTVGRDIVFDHGAYAPGALGGQRLLAHELAHVVQQGAGEPRLQREPAKTPPATAAPAAAASPYVAADPKRFNFCFIMGSKGVFKIADWYARAYFSEYETIHAASFCGLLEEISHRLNFRDANDPREAKLGRVVIITHADKEGYFHFPLTNGGTEWVSPEEIQEFLTSGWLQSNGLLCRMASTQVAGKSDTQTRVDVKGCNFGRNQAALDALRGAFGGQVTATAPKLRVQMELGSYGPAVPGRRTPAEVITWMVKNGYLPPAAEQWTAEKKAEFIASLFPKDEETKGIPADFLLDEANKKKLAPSDPAYAGNIATSAPTP